MQTVSLAAGGELRLLELQNAEAMFQVVKANQMYLQRWFGWALKVSSVDDTRESIRASLDKMSRGEAIRFGIWVEDALVGNIDFHTIDTAYHSAMMGYWLAEGAQGKGLATTAAKALVDLGFRELGLNRAAIWCDEDNQRSRRVAERLGMQREGLLREHSLLNGRYVGASVYSILRREWLGRVGHV